MPDGGWEDLVAQDFVGGPSCLVVGVDEVGRGALAGPVTAACVVFPPPVARFAGFGIGDSKSISREKREALSRWITENALHTAFGWASVEEIEQLNIRGATLLSMKRAVRTLPGSLFSDHGVLLALDGMDRLPDCPFPQRAIVGGDREILSIAAASILAKVARDRYMAEIDSLSPEYRFRTHKGYGTEEHREAIRRHGLSRHHRALFCRKALGL
ncbi:MAG: ribonuclease HII [Nitrospirae bacterium]|nr:MAG: Ribonuclease HII [Leptospirillum sp. Group IV 'UBA BS']MCL4485971.1 ribonuclease HII [Nitrospirota bacterium]MCL5285616.1 ribonuclease HII [Nitrospirota bacterium]